MQFKYKNLDPITVKLFQMRVDKEDSNGCMLWLGIKNGNGYGTFETQIDRIKYLSAAHRISWMLANGRDIPYGLFVCHTCDIPACVNPEHLFLGTNLDNVKDMHSKGRNVTRAILSESDVLEIRRLGKLNHTDSEIAKKFGVSRAHICDIRSYRKWKHVQ